jgi:hypothetical protein
MRNKTFDCVEMKRQGARRVREATAGMTPDQELAYWRDRDRALRLEQQALVAPQTAPAPPAPKPQ